MYYSKNAIISIFFNSSEEYCCDSYCNAENIVRRSSCIEIVHEFCIFHLIVRLGYFIKTIYIVEVWRGRLTAYVPSL